MESNGETALSNVADILMGQSPPGDTYNERGHGTPLLNGPTEFGASHPTPVLWTTAPTKVCEPGDLLFCVRGSTTGRMNWADRQYCVGRGVAAIRGKTGAKDTRFIFYSIVSELPRLLSACAGSVFPNLSQNDLKSFEIDWPERYTREVIAGVLGAMDDKIELNRRMNETLEALAQALFQSWFVDATQDGLPKGWREFTIGQLCEFAYGNSLKEDLRRPGSIPVYGSNGQIGWHDEALVKGPGIVVGRKGNPGIVTWSPTDFFPIDTTFYVVPKSECRSLYFLFHALRAHDLASLGADSAVPGLNRNMAYMSKQILPPVGVLDSFDKQVRSLFKRVHHNNEESRTLAALRYALLPKLLSGEARIRINKA